MTRRIAQVRRKAPFCPVAQAYFLCILGVRPRIALCGHACPGTRRLDGQNLIVVGRELLLRTLKDQLVEQAPWRHSGAFLGSSFRIDGSLQKLQDLHELLLGPLRAFCGGCPNKQGI